MSSGSFSVDAPHICGQIIHVEIKWWHSGGTWDEPPDGDEERIYYAEGYDYDLARCPKCKVDLDYDTIFEKTVDVIADNKYQDSEDDGPDWEPDDDFDADLVDRENWEVEEAHHTPDET